MYSKLVTEKPNPVSRDLDRLSVSELVRLMNKEDQSVPAAVGHVQREIVKAVNMISDGMGREKRLFFIGAGTSGRLCVMEAAECPPTFNTPPDLVQAVMAGGHDSVFKSREGAEDGALEAQRQIRRRVKTGDVVVGVAASGVTPFVLVGLGTARKKKAKTVLVTCNPQAALHNIADVVIAPNVGPEILTGSTRLKAGTAIKMILNMLTTLSMVRVGKVFGHWMVDVQPRSKKLVARAIGLVQRLGHVSEKKAGLLLKNSRGKVKIAIVMARKNISLPEAEKQLRKAKGFLNKILK